MKVGGGGENASNFVSTIYMFGDLGAKQQVYHGLIWTGSPTPTLQNVRSAKGKACS